MKWNRTLQAFLRCPGTNWRFSRQERCQEHGVTLALIVIPDCDLLGALLVLLGHLAAS